MVKMAVILYIVIPCYNEQEVLRETTRRLSDKLDRMRTAGLISGESRVVYVNDGSKDATWELIEEIHQENPVFSGISLAHNRGHQTALLAGLLTAKDYADVVISMDADLQDDIEVLDQMVEEYNKGNEIVYGVRSSRKKDTFFKKFTAEGFYHIMKLMGVEIVFNHADYRLTSKKVLENLSDYKEVNLFLRGIFPSIGYRHTTVLYERNERFAGESKYPLSKMLSFAWQGITSFTVSPLRFIAGLGGVISVVSLFALVWCVVQKFVGYTVDGWTSMLCSIWLLGGLQLFSLGIIGAYIGKIYEEVKHRPRFILEKNLLEEEK
jgi:glycosyltransferase involved in cell wall biosynthesis